jgi:hypothetical protein
MELCGKLHAPAAVPPKKEPWYPLDKRLSGPKSCSGRGGEEKNPKLNVQQNSTGDEFSTETAECYKELSTIRVSFHISGLDSLRVI